MSMYLKLRLMHWKGIEVIDRERNLILKRSYHEYMDVVYDLAWILKRKDSDGNVLKTKVIEERADRSNVLYMIDHVEEKRLPQLIEEILK